MIADRLARWSRWRLLASWWAVQSLLVLAAIAGAIVYVQIQFMALFAAELGQGLTNAWAALRDPELWFWWTVISAALAAVQAVVLWPVRRPAPIWRGLGGPGPGRSMWVTLTVCGLMIGLLWGGLVLALLDIPWLLGGYDWSGAAGHGGWWLLAPTLPGWAVATPLLVRFARGGRREDRLGRIASRVFLGTVIEVVALVPIDVMVRRKTDCYCGRGTFWAFLACGTVGFAALGPAVLLPLIARRRKRWYAGRCDACGYDMAGLPAADRCPECGAGWRR